MSLKPTTVRFVPGEATSPDELGIAVLHLYAYETAVGLVHPGTRVLDIGFGEGYGSEILSGAGADYRGLEVDPEIVAHARERLWPGLRDVRRVVHPCGRWLVRPLNVPLRRMVRRTAPADVDRSEFRLDRETHDETRVEDGLDLLAFARS
jgi:hypothetical protein